MDPHPNKKSEIIRSPIGVGILNRENTAAIRGPDRKKVSIMTKTARTVTTTAFLATAENNNGFTAWNSATLKEAEGLTILSMNVNQDANELSIYFDDDSFVTISPDAGSNIALQYMNDGTDITFLEDETVRKVSKLYEGGAFGKAILHIETEEGSTQEFLWFADAEHTEDQVKNALILGYCVPPAGLAVDADEDTSDDFTAGLQAASAVPGADEKPELSLPIGTEDARVRIYEDGEIDTALVTVSNRRWAEEEIKLVSDLFLDGLPMVEIVKASGRSAPAIIGALGRAGVVIADHPYAQRFAASDAERRKAREEQKAKAAEAA